MWLYLLLLPVLIITVKDGPGLGAHFKIAGIMLPVVALYSLAEGILHINIIQRLYPGAKYLSDTPINFWRHLLAITAPLLVFATGPKQSLCLRVARLVTAIALTNIFLNLSYHTDQNLDWNAYEQCLEDSYNLSGSKAVQEEECGHLINTADGGTIVFFLWMGWYPGAFYTLLLELLWRWTYRRPIGEMANSFKGKWASLALILLCAPVIIVLYICGQMT